ncbi:hypothetical protein FRC09_019938 [Ceratobasidium sp. 395]|nr:hypothetical protein FRC09_019938 [Ceratobasidium sp. 395]
MHLYKAEAYAFWFIYLAPILLHGKLNRVYYRHFLDMREIVLWCLQLEISNAEVDRLEQKVKTWVQDYERLYYQYREDHLPMCVLMIHALLHMTFYIRRTGPLTGTWSFVMERFCGYLLRPALLNRVQPYNALDNFIRRRAQMQIVAIVHSKPELVRPVTNLMLQHGELISTKETVYEFLPAYILGQPVKRALRPNDELKRRFTRYFGVAEGPLPEEGPPLTYDELVANIDWKTLVRYGKFRIASMGDRIRTAGLVRAGGGSRDNSFIRYEALPDRNARRPHARYHRQRRVYYARVTDIYYVEYIRDHERNTRAKYLLAMVQDCNTEGLDAAKPENPIVTYNQLETPELIHLGAVDAAVGRIRVGGRATWGIIDRTRGARTQFNDDAGFADPDID